MTLGGNVCIRNGIQLDYCWEEAIKSLLPICDKVIVCDSDSDDGTRQKIDEWCAAEPKLIPLNFPWENPKADHLYWPRWLNYARQHLPTDYHIQLDADEILHENSYDEVLRAVKDGLVLKCARFNFYLDNWHLVPKGVCLGWEVIRVAPTSLSLPSDYPDPHSGPAEAAARQSSVQIMHYGFIRKRESYFKKARVVHNIWAGQYDPRLEEAEKHDGNWMDAPGVAEWRHRLEEFTGTHPAVIHEWLKERNYVPCR